MDYPTLEADVIEQPTNRASAWLHLSARAALAHHPHEEIAEDALSLAANPLYLTE